MAYFQVDELAVEIGRFIGSVEADLKFRVLVQEGSKARQQPFVGQCRRRPDGQHRHRPVAADGAGGLGYALDLVGDGGEIAFAGFRQHHAAAHLGQQAHPELDLKRLDLLGDRRRRHAELLGGARDAAGARGGMENPNRLDRYLHAFSTRSGQPMPYHFSFSLAKKSDRASNLYLTD